jgi:hypothetical protein
MLASAQRRGKWGVALQCPVSAKKLLIKWIGIEDGCKMYSQQQ